MSGPKAASYSIESAEQREAQRLRILREQQRLSEARNNAREAHQQRTAISIAMAEFNARFPLDSVLHVPAAGVWVDSADSDQLEAATRRMKAEVATLIDILARAERQAQVNACLREFASSRRSSGSVSKRRDAPSGTRAAEEASKRQQIAAAIDVQIAANMDNAVPASFQSLLNEYRATSNEDRANLLRLELKRLLKQYQVNAMEDAALRMDAQVLSETLQNAQLPSEVASRDCMRAIAEGRQAPTLSAIDEARNQAELAKKRADASLQQSAAGAAEESAAVILNETLASLGYLTEPIAHTLFTEGGNVHFRKPDWGSEYFVKFRLRPDTSRVIFYVVRTEPDAQDNEAGKQQANDLAMEQEWCTGPDSELAVLRKHLADRGLRIGEPQGSAAGEKPVQTVDRNSIALPVEKKRRATKRSASQRLRTFGGSS